MHYKIFPFQMVGNKLLVNTFTQNCLSVVHRGQTGEREESGLSACISLEKMPVRY